MCCVGAMQAAVKSRLPPGLDMNVNVLTSGYWPSYPHLEATLPDQLTRHQTVFKVPFLSCHTTWNGMPAICRPCPVILPRTPGICTPLSCHGACHAYHLLPLPFHSTYVCGICTLQSCHNGYHLLSCYTSERLECWASAHLCCVRALAILGTCSARALAKLRCSLLSAHTLTQWGVSQASSNGRWGAVAVTARLRLHAVCASLLKYSVSTRTPWVELNVYC